MIPDRDRLFVTLGTLPNSCQDPWAAADCTGSCDYSNPTNPLCDRPSRLTFSLPPALQQPGVIDLSDPAIDATVTLSEDYETSACGRPKSRFAENEGTIEILSSDAGGLTFKVYRSVSKDDPEVPRRFAFDGLYSASICP